MAELEIGKHCTMIECKQLDFLPFICDGCQQIFCLDHRTKDAHSCTYVESSAPEKTVSSNPELYTCNMKHCKGKELVPVTCEHCHLNFCLSHRHPSEHNCDKVPVVDYPVPMAKTAQLVQEIKENQKPREVKRTYKTDKARKMAAKVALMKMKMHAEGDKSTPEIDRVYFQVNLPSCHKGASLKQYFFSKTQSIGRIVDWLSTRLKLTNENHLPNSKKLRLFHPDTKEMFAMDSKLSSLLEGTNSLYSGNEIFLEYVDNDIHVLS